MGNSNNSLTNQSTGSKEGYSGRKMTLYHCTNQKAAELILADKRFIRGQQGFFGPGIYFAETPDDAIRKARSKGVVLSAEVEVGTSLVVNDSSFGNTTYGMITAQGCQSVKGTCLTGDEWIVFNNSQAREINVHSGMSPKLCGDTECARYKKYHYGDCGKKCGLGSCLMHKKKHRAHCKTRKHKILWDHCNE